MAEPVEGFGHEDGVDLRARERIASAAPEQLGRRAPLGEPTSHLAIGFDGEHLCELADEHTGQLAGAGAELEHDGRGRETGGSDRLERVARSTAP